MQCTRILFVTGASGTGKTTLVRRVESEGIAGATFHYFDAVGVPSMADMVRDFGSPDNWQRVTTERWIERLVQSGGGLAVLEGQVRPTFIRDAFRRFNVDGHMLLIDCAHDVREARLRDERGQPELITRDMECWASYLRGQADALDLPVVDTSALSIDEAAQALHAHVAAHSAV